MSAQFPLPALSQEEQEPNDSVLEHAIGDDILRRYHQIVPTNHGPGNWHQQRRYAAPFHPGYRALTSEDVRDVLLQRRYVAVRAPADGLTDRIAFDIDCKSEGELERRDAHYWAIRRLLGIQRVPLVYRTPSGRGLRVAYRIPTVPLKRLVTGRRTGLVADVLRAAGLPVHDGEIEIYPQATQVDRLPCGRNMPILDPQTLEPLPEAAIGDEFDIEMLSGAVSAMERWYSAPHADLLPQLEALPGEPLTRVASGEGKKQKAEFVRANRCVKPGLVTLRLVQRGLSAPSTRYTAEWAVGIAILLAPELFADFAPAGELDDDAVARTLARWLAARHNGLSKEWAQSMSKLGSIERAEAAWTKRYLTRTDINGENLIHRLRRAAAALDGSLRRTLLLSTDERQSMIALAEQAGLTGSALYRAEVWLVACIRAVKSIIYHHTRAGTLLQERQLLGQLAVVVPIAGRWMQKWPYGKGSGSYVRYRQILINGGWMRLERYSPTAEAYRRGACPPEDVRREASTYLVRVPNLEVRVRDAGVEPRQLESVLRENPNHLRGRIVDVDEAHHILWLVRNRVPVRVRYGYRLGVRLVEIAGRLERGLSPDVV